MTVREDQPALVAASSLDTSLPAGAPLRASVDLHVIDTWAARISTVLDARDILQVERVLELPAGSLTGGSLTAGFGLDPSRPAIMAMAPLDPAWGPRLHAFQEMAGRLPPSGPLSEADDRAFEELMSNRPPLGLWVRAVVPVQDAMRALRIIQGLVAMTGEPWRTDVLGLDGMLIEEHDRMALGISHDSGSLVFDLWSEADLPRSSSTSGPFSRRAVAALARIRGRSQGGPSSPPLPLDGDALRIAVEPGGIAPLGFAHSLARVEAASGWSDLGPQARRELRAQGLREAHRVIELAGTERGSYFERFELRARGGPGAPEAELTAALGTAVTAAPGAWGPTTSIDFGARGSGIDVARAWLESFGPAGGDTSTPRAERLARQIREGGAWASIVAAPFLAAAWPQLLFPRDAPPLVTEAAVRASFERVGVVRPSPESPTVYWFGLLPEGATAAQAGRAARAAGGTSRVTRAGGRFVVLVASTREALTALPAFALARAPVSPGRAQADLAALVGPSDAAELAPWLGPGPFRAELELEGSTLHVRLRGQ